MNDLERHLRRAYAPGGDFDAQTDSFTEALFARAERARLLAALAWLRERAVSRAESLARVLPRLDYAGPPLSLRLGQLTAAPKTGPPAGVAAPEALVMP